MAFVNMFNDRVEQFNLREENERLAELFSDEKLQEEAQWQAYSVKEISRLFSISEEEALKLMNCGLFKTYRVGNEYRASKKSVEENKKIVKAVLTYQDKKTMSVPDVMRILCNKIYQQIRQVKIFSPGCYLLGIQNRQVIKSLYQFFHSFCFVKNGFYSLCLPVCQSFFS